MVLGADTLHLKGGVKELVPGIQTIWGSARDSIWGSAEVDDEMAARAYEQRPRYREVLGKDINQEGERRLPCRTVQPTSGLT